jgi:hypothetical protein
MENTTIWIWTEHFIDIGWLNWWWNKFLPVVFKQQHNPFPDVPRGGLPLSLYATELYRQGYTKHVILSDVSWSWSYPEYDIAFVRTSAKGQHQLNLINHEVAHFLTEDREHCSTFPLLCPLTKWGPPLDRWLAQRRKFCTRHYKGLVLAQGIS